MTFSSEFLAILRVLDGDPSRFDSGKLRSLLSSEAFDWQLLGNLLVRHRVLALFVSGLRSAGLLGLVPKGEWLLWEERLRSNQLRQLSAIGDLIELSGALKKEGVEFLCLKGPVLGVLLYKDPLLRHFSDLDLLVRPKDIRGTVSILIGLGFRLLEHVNSQLRDPADLMWKHLHHLHLVRGKLSLELHWRLSRNDRLMDASLVVLFEEKQTVNLGGAVLHTLGDRHLGDYIALHGASHCWNRLKWLYDTESLRRLSGDARVKTDQPRAVSLVQSLCGHLWPKKPSNRLPLPQGSIETLCLHQILSLEDYPGALSNMYRRTRVLVHLHIGLRAKMAYLGGLLVWPQIYEKVRFPRGLAFLYYFLGPILWANSQLRMVLTKKTGETPF